jgi:hypothetical protein
MLKIYTILLLSVSILRTFPVNAQASLHCDSSAYYIMGSSSGQVESHIKIVNTGSSAISAQVARTFISLATGHSERFCWGTTCYPPGTLVSSYAETMQAGATDSTFIGYIFPNGHNGISVVRYLFYDLSNASDTVSVTLTYDITTGIPELTSKATVTNAYPNPADGVTSLSYSVNPSKDARLVFYNMLGSVVKEIKLTDRQSALVISTSDLKSGVYFYSLVVDGKSMASKKLVVAHR